MWNPADIVDAAARAVMDEASRLDAEDAVRGIDEVPERALQALLAQAFAAAGWTVEREVRYPSRRPVARSAGARCDLVLTQGAPLQPDAPASLFDPEQPTPPEGACWIEVKVAAARDVEGPVAGYARTLSQGCLHDVATLAGEPCVRHGLALLVLFGESQAALRRDVSRWSDDAAASSLPVEWPRVRTFAIRDRRGNAAAAVVGVPVSAPLPS